MKTLREDEYGSGQTSGKAHGVVGYQSVFEGGEEIPNGWQPPWEEVNVKPIVSLLLLSFPSSSSSLSFPPSLSLSLSITENEENTLWAWHTSWATSEHDSLFQEEEPTPGRHSDTDRIKGEKP